MDDDLTGWCYDPDGNPITARAWSELHARLARQPRGLDVGFDVVGSRAVSTVWIGIDHGFGRTPRPLIYETMIFPECDYCVRTPTRHAALAAHDQALAELRDGNVHGDDADDADDADDPARSSPGEG